MTHPPTTPSPFVSRGGLKLAHALDEFAIDVRGLRAADFGCNVGGFTDCLLQRGASHITAIDTGYGTLAWKLRTDARVSVMERTNALHAPPPALPDRVDLVVVDMAWTPQRLCIPAALKWLKEDAPPGGRIITLIKPHYELGPDEKNLLHEGVLEISHAERTMQRVLTELPSLGVEVLGCTLSPIIGGKTKGNTEGNREWLAHLRPKTSAVPTATA